MVPRLILLVINKSLPDPGRYLIFWKRSGENGCTCVHKLAEKG